MNNSWYEISCSVPECHAEVVGDFLTEYTGSGVSLDNRMVDAFSPDEIPVAKQVLVKAYIPQGEESPVDLLAPVEKFLHELEVLSPGEPFAKPLLSVVDAEDWSTSWKAHFKPLRIGRHLLIVPTWEDIPHTDGDLVIRIDPGMAFGTGGHETTRLCLELLESVMEGAALFSVPSLLDLGTGSGILAMAANLLGAGRILALDIDPDAVVVARENLAINSMAESIECGTDPLESLAENFDIILANILAEELVRLAPHLAERLLPGGSLILSGILAEKEAFVKSGFVSQPLEYVRTAYAGEWVAMLYQKTVKL